MHYKTYRALYTPQIQFVWGVQQKPQQDHYATWSDALMHFLGELTGWVIQFGWLSTTVCMYVCTVYKGINFLAIKAHLSVVAMF